MPCIWLLTASVGTGLMSCAGASFLHAAAEVAIAAISAAALNARLGLDIGVTGYIPVSGVRSII